MTVFDVVHMYFCNIVSKFFSPFAVQIGLAYIKCFHCVSLTHPLEITEGSPSQSMGIPKQDI